MAVLKWQRVTSFKRNNLIISFALFSQIYLHWRQIFTMQPESTLLTLMLACLAPLKVFTADNVLGQPLQQCSFDANKPTGWHRNGYCTTDQYDHGTHVVCADMTDEFLLYSKSMGNDLISPAPMYNFKGLVAGDRWCLCALRWKQAYNVGKAPPVIIGASHSHFLDFIDEGVKKQLNITQKRSGLWDS